MSYSSNSVPGTKVIIATTNWWHGNVSLKMANIKSQQLYVGCRAPRTEELRFALARRALGKGLSQMIYAAYIVKGRQ